MRRLGLRSYAFSICAATMLLTGCAVSQTPISAPGTTAQSMASRSTSGGELLYISDETTDDVYFFSYPSGSLTGTLTGFGTPQGLCSDNAGDVFVTDEKDADVVEYAHGGTSPIKTLEDSGRPSSCAVDPATGDLAVSNFNSFVSIYKQAEGSPTDYSTAASAVFCTYGKHGKLYIDEPGQPSTGNVVQVLPHGGTSFENVSLNERLGNFSPAGIQWYGKDLVVGSAGAASYGCCGRIFIFAVKGTNGQRTGGFHIKKTLGDFFVYGSTIIATTSGDAVQYYDYPSGDGPTQTIYDPGGSSYGVTVSAAPSGAGVH